MIEVEVVYDNEKQQALLTLQINDHSTVYDALCHLKIKKNFDLKSLEPLSIGIFSQQVTLHHRLKTGDRIEIYRPLKIAPKQARRKRAKKASLK